MPVAFKGEQCPHCGETVHFEKSVIKHNSLFCLNCEKHFSRAQALAPYEGVVCPYCKLSVIGQFEPAEPEYTHKGDTYCKRCYSWFFIPLGLTLSQLAQNINPPAAPLPEKSTKMIYKIKVAALTASLTKYVNDQQEAFDASIKAFNENKQRVADIVEANKDSILKASGTKRDNEFSDSVLSTARTSIMTVLGFPTVAPMFPGGVASARAYITKLALMEYDDVLELVDTESILIYVR